MLTKIHAKFTTKRDAQYALTAFRKKYRVALRGAVVLGPEYDGAYYVHVTLGSTGFSASEMAAALHAAEA